MENAKVTEDVCETCGARCVGPSSPTKTDLATALRARTDVAALVAIYKNQLLAFQARGLFKPKQVEDMVAAFTDGVRSALQQVGE